MPSSHGNNLRDIMANEWSTPTSMDAEAHSTVVCTMNFHPLVIVRLAKCHYCTLSELLCQLSGVTFNSY